ncbi:Transposase for insertion sequence element IS904 [Salmonella enterica]|uniref:Transposase for insertion sequence element IS904 n=1 Tax=Salmonella enterica TaxID=28901 RepID=A0A379QG49_SALER|nr:Transposase for insertion sequence element IS904 [Salmonella enterica]
MVIDLWSRAVIGWSMSSRMTTKLAYDALQMAIWRRKRPDNVIVHTDRGGQYCSADYQALLKRHSLYGSMSAKGCSYDNAGSESVFHSLKVECIHGERFISRKKCGRRYLIILSVITIGGVVTVPVAVSARNSLKTRTSLRAVSTLRG